MMVIFSRFRAHTGLMSGFFWAMGGFLAGKEAFAKRSLWREALVGGKEVGASMAFALCERGSASVIENEWVSFSEPVGLASRGVG